MRKIVIAAVAVALVVGCVPADCAPTASIPTGWSWVGPAGAPTVAVVGDSLTWQAEHGSSSTTDPYYQRHALTDQINAAGFRARIAARSGEDTRVLPKWGGWQTAPDVIVMALGTNDRRYAPTVWPGFPFQLGTSQWNVVPYLGRWPRARVVVVGVVEANNQWRHDIYGPAWNRWLRYYAALRGGVFVDWWAISKDHPEYFTADRLHHTATGQAAYRAAIVDAIEGLG